MGADAKKFSEIWEMNEIEAKQLARQVLEADRVVYEQQLGLTWSPSTELYVLSILYNFISHLYAVNNFGIGPNNCLKTLVILSSNC